MTTIFLKLLTMISFSTFTLFIIILPSIILKQNGLTLGWSSVSLPFLMFAIGKETNRKEKNRKCIGEFCIIIIWRLLAADSSSICPNVVCLLQLWSSWKKLANCLLTACWLFANCLRYVKTKGYCKFVISLWHSKNNMFSSDIHILKIDCRIMCWV